MIIGTKRINDGKIETTYVIKDIYKGPDMSIDSYRVALSRNIGGPFHDVILNTKEMLAVAYRTSAAYDYIDQVSKGMNLYEFSIYGYDESHVGRYMELTKQSISSKQLEFNFSRAYNISLEDYCSCYCDAATGVTIQPRYTLDGSWWPICYQDNLEQIHLEHKTQLTGLENFEIVIHGLIWIPDNIRDMRDHMSSEHEFIKYAINEWKVLDRLYRKALNENNDIFEERLNIIMGNLAADENGKDE